MTTDKHQLILDYTHFSSQQKPTPSHPIQNWYSNAQSDQTLIDLLIKQIKQTQNNPQEEEIQSEKLNFYGMSSQQDVLEQGNNFKDVIYTLSFMEQKFTQVLRKNQNIKQNLFELRSKTHQIEKNFFTLIGNLESSIQMKVLQNKDLQNSINYTTEEIQLLQNQLLHHHQNLQNTQSQIQHICYFLNQVKSDYQSEIKKLNISSQQYLSLFNSLLIIRQQLLTLKEVNRRIYTYSMKQESDIEDRLFGDIFENSNILRQILIDVMYFLITETNLKIQNILRTNSYNSQAMLLNYSSQWLTAASKVRFTEYQISEENYGEKQQNSKMISIEINQKFIFIIYEAIKTLINNPSFILKVKQISCKSAVFVNLDGDEIIVNFNPQFPNQRHLVVRIREDS